MIKYAIFGVTGGNLGDNAQSYALYHIYRQMRVPEEDIVFITYEDCASGQFDGSGDTIVMPMVMGDAFYLNLIKLLIEKNLSDRFIFLSIALGQTRHAFRDEQRLAKFSDAINKFSMPIGCRDCDSAEMYGNLGYRTYVNGCVTNTFPRRDQSKAYDGIYIIDAPKSLFSYIPEDIKNGAEYFSNDIGTILEGDGEYRLAVARYDKLRDTARLVITCRYHIATPCAAMGIPVIMVESRSELHNWTLDNRLASLNPQIPFYTQEQFKDIDWNPKPAMFEGEKRAMANSIISRIKSAVETHEAVNEAANRSERFFAASKERFHDTFLQNRHKIDIYGFSAYLDGRFLNRIGSRRFGYYLYGLSDRYIRQDECLMLDYVKRRYPDASFLGFVDISKAGSSRGG
jgi:hypothetical protein